MAGKPVTRGLLPACVMGALLGAASCTHASPYLRPGIELVSLAAPPASEILQRVLLIGDAGAPSMEGEPVLLALHDTAAALPDRTVVVFLGDNVYPDGIPDLESSERADAERRLDAQLAAAAPAYAIFVAGNHDWDKAKPGGLEAVRRQAALVNAHSNAIFSPRAGCAGPDVHELQGVRLVTLDTQWWLHVHERGADCAQSEPEAVLAALEAAVQPADQRPVVVVGHHPLRTRGPHGGFYTLGEWIFPSWMAEGKWRWLLLPLPGLGPLGRWMVRSDQDLRSSGNTAFRAAITGALRSRRPIVYASGHDHSLQVFEDGGTAELMIVSGLGSSTKATPVGDDEDTLFAHQHPGFMVLDFLSDRLILRVVEPGGQGVVFRHEVPYDHP